MMSDLRYKNLIEKLDFISKNFDLMTVKDAKEYMDFCNKHFGEVEKFVDDIINGNLFLSAMYLSKIKD